MGLSLKVMSLSDKAAERVRQIVEGSKTPIIGLRVGVKNGGCAGMSYTIEAADAVRPGDEVVTEKVSLIRPLPKRSAVIWSPEIPNS